MNTAALIYKLVRKYSTVFSFLENACQIILQLCCIEDLLDYSDSREGLLEGVILKCLLKIRHIKIRRLFQ
jgi:hypothetical protein